MSDRTLDPRPMPEIQGKGDEANLPAAWRRRGELLAEASIAEWPFIDWKVAQDAAAAFTIADGLDLIAGGSNV